jgi:uncharacterized protein (TIGR00369 family)
MPAALGQMNDMTKHELNNPFLEALGASLVAWRDGYVEMRLPLSPMLQNRSGVVQGGAISTLLDAAAGYAGLYSAPGEKCVHSQTLSLTSNFLTNGKGEVLTGKGYVEKKGGSVYFARAEVWLDEDVLMATAIGTFRYLRLAGWQPPAQADRLHRAE